MSAAIYLRISRDQEGQELGVGRQLEDCYRLAERLGLTVAPEHVYRDNDISASTLSKKSRPDYQRMLADVRAGEVSTVLAYSNSRLTRRPAEWIELIGLANEGRLTIRTVASGSHDLSTADGRAVALTVAAWDAAEAERTSERIKRKFEQNRKDGKPRQAGSNRLFGFTGSPEWLQVPAEVAVIREVYARALKGESIRSITMDLASRNVKTSAGHAWSWYATQRILKQPLYAGKLVYKGAPFGKAELPEPPIVSVADFEAVQRVLSGRDAGRNGGSKRNDGRRALLAGLLYCGKCHGSAGARSGDYYACAVTRNGCGGVAVKRPELERLIENYVRTRLFFDLSGVPGDADEKRKAEAETARAEAEAIQRQITETQGAIASRALTVSDGAAILSDLRAELGRVRAAEAALAVPSGRDAFTDVDQYDASDVAQRATEVARHFSSITVNPASAQRGRKFQPARIEVELTNGERLTGEELRERSLNFMGSLPLA